MENSTTDSVGKVIQLNGQALAISETGTRELHLDSDVFQGETIVTKDASNLEIVFNDETSLSQGENAEAVINTYVYDPDNVDGSSLLLEMGKGVFRTVTGEIAKENPDNFKLKSPMALIGIRGTVVNSEIGDGQESIGVETIGKGHVLVVQDSQGNIQFISDPLKIMDILAGQPLSAPRNMSRQELNNFQSAAPNSVDMDPARQAELNARVDAAEAEAAAEEAEQAAQEAEEEAAQAQAEAEAAARAEEEAQAALEEAQEEGDQEAIAEAEAALKAAAQEAARAEAEEAAAKAAAEEAQAAREAAQAEAEAKAQAVKNMTPEEPEEYEPAGDDDPDNTQGTDNPDTGDQGSQDNGNDGDTGNTGDTGYRVVGLVQVDDQGQIQYYTAAGEGEESRDQDPGTGTQGGDADEADNENQEPLPKDDTVSGEDDVNFNDQTEDEGDGEQNQDSGNGDDDTDPTDQANDDGSGDPDQDSGNGDEDEDPNDQTNGNGDEEPDQNSGNGTPGGDTGGGDDLNHDPPAKVQEGTSDSDTLYGLSDSDILYGREGDDFLDGGAGNDTLAGGEGNDHLRGDEGDDSLLGESGHDVLAGNEGNDTIDGGEGNDNINGWIGNDRIFGGDGDDTLFGGEGQDTLLGGSGSNSMDGEGDFDVASYADSGSGIRVTMNSPVTVYHGSGQDTLENIEYIQGSFYDDVYDGDGRYMIFEGGMGNDTIFGGTDDMADTGVSYFYSPVAGDGTGVNVSLEGASSGGVFVNDGCGTKDLLVNVRTLVGSMGDDSLTGEAGVKNWLLGMAGSDSIDGGALTEAGYENTASYEMATGPVAGGIVYDYDSNSFTGSLINDSIGGQDTLTHITRLQGSDYNDDMAISLSGSGSDSFLHWYFRSSEGNDTFTGTQGYHVGVMYNNADGAVNVDLDAGTATKMDSLGGVEGVDSLVDIEEVMGSDSNDTIYGEAADGNVFIGSLGDDIMDGRAFGFGDMVVYDNYSGDYIGMVIDLAAGTDALGFPTGTARAVAQSETLFTDTLYHIDAIMAGGGDDTIIGSDRANSLFGQEGDDEFKASLGDDFIQGGDGWDEISYLGLSTDLSGISLSWYDDADGGQWIVSGYGEISPFTDTIEDMEAFEGTEGNDTFIGNSEDTFFEGTYGNDRYDGGGGIDHVSYDDIEYGDLAWMEINLAPDNPDNPAVQPYAAGYTYGENQSLEVLFTDTLENIEIITGSIYNDSIIGNSQGNDLRGDAGNDTIEGGEGNDALSGGDGNDSLLGGYGSDNIWAGFGDDYVDGGSGGGDGFDWDMVSYSDLSGFNGIDLTWDNVNEQWAVSGIDLNDNPGLFQDILVNVEGFQGSQYEDDFHGNTDVNYFLGSLGNDFYDGGDGEDHLSYYLLSWGSSITSGLEIDLVSGTVDTSVDEANEFTDTFSHMEEIMGTQFDDRFIAGAQSSYTLHGGDGTDEISYASLSNQTGINLSYNDDTFSAFQVSYDAGSGQSTDTLDGIEAFEGSGYDDTLSGHTTDEIFYGTFGNDSYDGLGGTDSLIYDRISHLNLIGMEIDLNAGTARAMDGTVDGLFLDTIENIESVTGSAFDDTIYADADGGEIIGAGGDDNIWGGSGSDILFGGDGYDTFKLTHTSENDEIRDFQVTDDGSGKDTLLFSESMLNIASKGDYLFGQSGSNQLDPTAFNIIGITGEQAAADWSDYLDVINNAVDVSLDPGGDAGTYFIVNNGTDDYSGDARIFYWEGDTMDTGKNVVDSDEIVEIVTLTDTSLSEINDMTEEHFSVA